MPPRLRIALVILGVVLVIGVVLYQMYSVLLRPSLQWQQERAEDRMAYQKLTGLATRADVEKTLSGWKAERLEGVQYCAALQKRNNLGADGCTTADHEITYQRQRPVIREAPLTPLRIVVVYDRGDHVITASTLD